MVDGTSPVETLQQFGYTEYEARCIVALTRQPDATAAEISEIGDLPRSRVYDVAESLADEGLIAVQNGDPRRYSIGDVDQFLAEFEADLSDRLSTLDAGLRNLEPAEPRAEGSSESWRIVGERRIIDRTCRLVETADDEVFLFVNEPDLLRDPCLDAVGEAAERGVSVTVVANDGALLERVERRLADAGDDVAVKDVALIEDRPVARLLLVDRESVLVALVEETDDGEEVLGRWSETAQDEFGVAIRELMAACLEGLGAD